MIYGTKRYGTDYYGVGTDLYLWWFRVAWDGTYDGTNECARMIDFSLVRGRDKYIGDSGIEHYKPGQVTVVLDNSDRRYDPWNTSSHLYPNVRPGKLVKCGVKNGSSGTDYDLMHGIIKDIQPFRNGNIECVRITVVDALEWLRTNIVSVELSETQTFGECVELILDATSPPAEWTYATLANGDTIDYFWCSSTQALSILQQLELSECGTFFQRSDGSFAWVDREELPETTTEITEDKVLRDIQVSMPWENIVNNAIVGVTTMTEHDIDDVLWTMSTVPQSFSPGVYKYFDITFSYNGKPAIGLNFLSVPSWGDSYPYLTGSGDLEFLYINVGAAAFSGTLSLLYLQSYGSCQVDTFEIHGDAIYQDDTYSVISEDATSIAEYGRKSVSYSPTFMQDEDVAQIIADGLVANLKDPIPLPIIKIENRPEYQFAFDLYVDAINLKLASRDLDETYRIGRIEHKWITPNGQGVQTTFNLEPNLDWS